MKKSRNNIKKNLICSMSIVLVFLLGLYFFIDGKNMYIDFYNFGQLRKSIPILESIPKDEKKFAGLKVFNDTYKADIQPIENCYHISTSNGNQKYIFGFQLKSKIYKYIYGDFYFYPKYDIAFSSICTTGPGGGCFDRNKKAILELISSPCKD